MTWLEEILGIQAPLVFKDPLAHLLPRVSSRLKFCDHFLTLLLLMGDRRQSVVTLPSCLKVSVSCLIVIETASASENSELPLGRVTSFPRQRGHWGPGAG